VDGLTADDVVEDEVSMFGDERSDTTINHDERTSLHHSTVAVPLVARAVADS